MREVKYEAAVSWVFCYAWASLISGKINGSADAADASDFLKGAGASASVFVPPIPAVPFVNIGGGINHSYGGKAAVEIGFSTQPGAGISPAGYGFDLKDEEGNKNEALL